MIGPPFFIGAWPPVIPIQCRGGPRAGAVLRERKAFISVERAGDEGLMFLENRCECGWADCGRSDVNRELASSCKTAGGDDSPAVPQQPEMSVNFGA